MCTESHEKSSIEYREVELSEISKILDPAAISLIRFFASEELGPLHLVGSSAHEIGKRLSQIPTPSDDLGQVLRRSLDLTVQTGPDEYCKLDQSLPDADFVSSHRHETQEANRPIAVFKKICEKFNLEFENQLDHATPKVVAWNANHEKVLELAFYRDRRDYLETLMEKIELDPLRDLGDIEHKATLQPHPLLGYWVKFTDGKVQAPAASSICKIDTSAYDKLYSIEAIHKLIEINSTEEALDLLYEMLMIPLRLRKTSETGIRFVSSGFKEADSFLYHDLGLGNGLGKPSVEAYRLFWQLRNKFQGNDKWEEFEEKLRHKSYSYVVRCLAAGEFPESAEDILSYLFPFITNGETLLKLCGLEFNPNQESSLTNQSEKIRSRLRSPKFMQLMAWASIGLNGFIAAVIAICLYDYRENQKELQKNLDDLLSDFWSPCPDKLRLQGFLTRTTRDIYHMIFPAQIRHNCGLILDLLDSGLLYSMDQTQLKPYRRDDITYIGDLAIS